MVHRSLLSRHKQIFFNYQFTLMEYFIQMKKQIFSSELTYQKQFLQGNGSLNHLINAESAFMS